MRVLASITGIVAVAVFWMMGQLWARWSHPRATTPDHSRIVVAAVGDSNTFGVGVLAAYPWLSYPARLQRLLGAEFQVVNFGFSGRAVLTGADLPYTAEPMYEESLGSGAGIVVIMLGTNDAKRVNWDPEAFERDLTRLVRSYADLPHSPRVLLLTPPQLRRNPYTMDRDVLAHRIVPAVRRTAESCGVQLVDVYQRTGSRWLYTLDGAHLSRRGYAALAGVVRESICRSRP